MSMYAIEDWNHATFPSPTERGDVHLFFPRGAEHMEDLARSYWTGELENLELVRAHGWGGLVQRGIVDSLGQELYFKRFSIRNPRYIHKPPRARRTVLQQSRAEASGFYVPRLVALIERRRAGVIVDSAIISEAVDCVVSAEQLLTESKYGYLNNHRKRRQLVRALGKEVGRWHRAGFFHGDLHMYNLLVREGQDALEFVWIDNEEGKLFTRIPLRCRVHDLHHVNRMDYPLPMTDRMRFWEAYAEAAAIPPTDETRIMRKVIAKSQVYWKKRRWI